MTILHPASIWGQFANLFFFSSGLFGDLLLIRICLLGAYTFLLVAASTGYPSWPEVSNGPAGEPGYFSLDGIIWAVLNLLLHGVATARLLWDERRIKFSDPLQQQLWLFFYRRAGMGKLEWQQSFKRVRLASYRAGQTVMDERASRRTFMLLVEGVASYTVVDKQGKLLQQLEMHSGFCFDVGLLNVLGVYIAFEKHLHDSVTVTATTDCVACFWDLEDLNFLATRCSPAVSAYWRNFAMAQMGLEWHSRAYPQRLPLNGRGKPEPAGILDGTARSSDFTDPQQGYEDPPATLGGVLTWLLSTLHPLLPPGMRHNAMPLSGNQARNRLLTLATRRHDPALPPHDLARCEALSHRGRSRAIIKMLAAEGLLDPEEVVEVVVVVPDDASVAAGDTAGGGSSGGGGGGSGMGRQPSVIIVPQRRDSVASSLNLCFSNNVNNV